MYLYRVTVYHHNTKNLQFQIQQQELKCRNVNDHWFENKSDQWCQDNYVILYCWQVLRKSVYGLNAKDTTEIIGPDFCYGAGALQLGEFFILGFKVQGKTFFTFDEKSYAIWQGWLTRSIFWLFCPQHQRWKMQTWPCVCNEFIHIHYTKSIHQDYSSQLSLPAGSSF